MREIYNGLNIIGSDETGVGDYFTPLVVCAAFVPYQNIKKLIQLGVKDSKALNKKQIQDIANKIKPLLIHQIKHLSQEGYNKLNKNFNAHELKSLLHISAINEVEKKVDVYDKVIIDQFSSKDSTEKYFNRLFNSSFNLSKFRKPLVLVERGESEHPAVAAASILARAYLLEYMKKQNQQYNTIFPLGTSKITEKFAISFVKKHGTGVLIKTAKISFKTTKKLFGEIKYD